MFDRKIIIEEYDNQTYFFKMPEGVAKIVTDIFYLQMNLKQQPTVRNIIHQLPHDLAMQVFARVTDRKPTEKEKNDKQVVLKHSLDENV